MDAETPGCRPGRACGQGPPCCGGGDLLHSTHPVPAPRGPSPAPIPGLPLCLNVTSAPLLPGFLGRSHSPSPVSRAGSATAPAAASLHPHLLEPDTCLGRAPPPAAVQGQALEPTCPVPVTALPRASCASRGVPSRLHPVLRHLGSGAACLPPGAIRGPDAHSSVPSPARSASRIPVTTLPCPQEVRVLSLLASFLVSSSVRGQACARVSERSSRGPGPAEGGRAGRVPGTGPGQSPPLESPVSCLLDAGPPLTLLCSRDMRSPQGPSRLTEGPAALCAPDGGHGEMPHRPLSSPCPWVAPGNIPDGHPCLSAQQ